MSTIKEKNNANLRYNVIQKLANGYEDFEDNEIEIIEQLATKAGYSSIDRYATAIYSETASQGKASPKANASYERLKSKKDKALDALVRGNEYNEADLHRLNDNTDNADGTYDGRGF